MEILLEGEIPNKFYHGSNNELKPGTILGGRKFQSNFGDAEKILEIFRPAEMNSRLNSVFMVSRPSYVNTSGGSDAYIYLVEPLDEPQKHYQGWLGEIYYLAMINSDELTKKGPKLKKSTINNLLNEAEPLAKNYWYGKKYSGSGDKMWEFLCKNAKIIKEVKVR